MVTAAAGREVPDPPTPRMNTTLPDALIHLKGNTCASSSLFFTLTKPLRHHVGNTQRKVVYKKKKTSCSAVDSRIINLKKKKVWSALFLPLFPATAGVVPRHERVVNSA